MTLLAVLMLSCSSGQMVDDQGRYSRLFPKTPLSDAPCIEDQDCIVTPLKDGSCCPDSVHSAQNLYSRDQYDKLVAHQAQICLERQGQFTCPEPKPPGHIDMVYRGACVENRCVLQSVPSEAPGTPVAPPPPEPSLSEEVEALAPDAPTPTAASPRPR